MDFDKESPLVQKWVDELYRRLVSEKKIDVPELPPARKDKLSAHDWQTIDLNSLRHRDVREIGCEWLCYQALKQLGLEDFLASQEDWSVEDARLALTHIISRAVYPASELKTSRWIKENSSVCELMGFSMEKITKDHLYGISNRLYSMKDQLERYLSHRTNELLPESGKSGQAKERVVNERPFPRWLFERIGGDRRQFSQKARNETGR